MASKQAVATALKMFALTFAGDVSDERVDLYQAALADVDDAALKAATTRLVATHKGEWIPVPALIREAAGANVRPRVDAEAVRHAIYEIAGYNPNGFSPPRVEAVRQRLGDAVADAYGAVGGGRLFADGTTGEIALRDFAKELEACQRERGILALPAGPLGPKRLPASA